MNTNNAPLWTSLARVVSRQRISACRSNQRGLSIVELMVALVISMLILIGLVQVFVSSRATYDVDEGLSRLQENGRFAMDFMVRDLRMSGYQGCLNISAIPPKDLDGKFISTVDPTLASFQALRGAVEGFDFNGTNPGDNYALPALYPVTTTSNTTPALDLALVGDAAPGSDVLVIRGMDTETLPLITYQPDELVVDQSPMVRQDQIYMLADCNAGVMFQATSVSTSGGQSTIRHDTGGNSINTCAQWGTLPCKVSKEPQPRRSQLARFNTVAYYIGAGAYGGPSLIRRSWANGGPQDLELVEGVENMQVLYGYNQFPDKDKSGQWGNTDMYLPANRLPIDATGRPIWQQVTAVRLSLLVSGRTTASTSGLSDTDVDQSTYGVGGVTIDPVDDKRQRRVFTTTIRLRNR